MKKWFRPVSVAFIQFSVCFLFTQSTPAAEIKKGGLNLEYDTRDGRITTLTAEKPAWKASDFEGGFQIYLQNEPETNGEWIASDRFISQPPVVNVAEASLSRQAVYTNGTDKVEVMTTVQIKDEQTVAWTIKVANHSSKFVMKVRYPVLKNIKFTAGGKEDELLWPVFTTMLIKDPMRRVTSAAAGELDPEGDILALTAPLHYPRACVNFIDLSGAGRGLTLVGDPSLIMNEYAFAASAPPGALDLRIDMVSQITPGSDITYGFLTYLHPGNWRNGADFYRRHFEQRYPQPTYPEWLKNSNGWLAMYWGNNNFEPAYGADLERIINEAWQLGLDHIQLWGQTGNHACPGYPLPDPLRGGEEGMKKMIQAIRQAGFHTGVYFWSCGISKFDVLSPSYRGVPWEDLPAEVRPPSWQWLVENSHYPTAERKAPDKEMTSNSWKRSKCKTIAEAAAQKLDPQQLHAMAFLAKPFRDWLYFWIERYVSNYGCDTPYLDVHGCRPKYPEFNPYLKKFGDGTEGQLRYAFLKDLVANFRARDPNFVPIIEGTIDAYQVYAASLVSGRRRFMEGYRYTFPMHILYEGHGNGWWNKSLEALSYAFLDGNRFDLIKGRCDPESKRLIWLRESLMPWVAKGRYLGKDGFTISSDQIEGALIDARQELGSALINIRNFKKEKNQTIAISEDLRKTFSGAFLIPLSGEPKKITDLSRPAPIPDTTVSALLLYRKSPALKTIPFVTPVAGSAGSRFEFQALNLGSEKTKVKWEITRAEDGSSLGEVSEEIEPESGKLSAFALPADKVSGKTVRLLIKFTAGDSKPIVFRRTNDSF